MGTTVRLAHEHAEAASKEEVLGALSQAATRLREQLGESLSSVEKYDTPWSRRPRPRSVRAEAYRAEHQGREAANEFQKILDQAGIVVNEPIGALARLGLARAYVLRGDTIKARTAYQDFLTLWKDADSDISVFIAAKAEYGKLH